MPNLLKGNKNILFTREYNLVIRTQCWLPPGSLLRCPCILLFYYKTHRERGRQLRGMRDTQGKRQKTKNGRLVTWSSQPHLANAQLWSGWPHGRFLMFSAGLQPCLVVSWKLSQQVLGGRWCPKRTTEETGALAKEPCPLMTQRWQA